MEVSSRPTPTSVDKVAVQEEVSVESKISQMFSCMVHSKAKSLSLLI